MSSSKIMYQVNRILNNTSSANIFTAGVNSDGSRIIVADTLLPDLSAGTPTPQTGSFKVYDVKYNSDMHISSMIQVGQTIVGATDESLGIGVGISGDGSMVLATSNTEVFKVYSYNRATSTWDVMFAAGETSNLGSPVNILGIRYDANFENILTANVSPEGNTTLVYHVKQGSTWVCPDFSVDPLLLERYSRIRGLWTSDNSVIVHFQATTPETSFVRLLITKLNTDSFSDYGSITEFASDIDTNEYKGIQATINRQGTHIGVSYYKDNKVHLKIYAVDVDLNWNMVKKFSFALDTPNAERSSAVVFDDSIVSDGTSVGIPGKMMIAVTNSFSSDKFYGIYTNSYNPVTHEYSTSQDVSFGRCLDSLVGNTAELLSFAGTISKNFKLVLSAFTGPVPESDSEPRPLFGPAHYQSFPAEGITNVGDFNSDGISLALFVKSCADSGCHSSECDKPVVCDKPAVCDEPRETTITITTSKRLNLTMSTQ